MKKMGLLLLLLLSACQEKLNDGPSLAAPNSMAIIGGTEVTASEDPLLQTVFLHRRLFNPREKIVDGVVTGTLYSMAQCSASALTRNTLLLAAHCLSTDAVVQRIETKNENGELAYYNVKKFVVHSESDLAMVHLQNPLPENTVLVTLPEAAFPVEITEVQAAGYGLTSGIPGAVRAQSILRTTMLKILEYKPEALLFTVDQTQGQGLCTGDSGGPALVKIEDKLTVIGVASQVQYLTEDPDLNICNYRADYLNVFLFRDWILDNLKSFAKEELATRLIEAREARLEKL